MFAHTERQAAYRVNAVGKVDHHAVARAADAVDALVAHWPEAGSQRNEGREAIFAVTAAGQPQFDIAAANSAEIAPWGVERTPALFGKARPV